VPYSTTGYDELGTSEGYTNVSVRASGPYQISTPARANESLAFIRHQATANVTEAQVVGADDSPVTVELTEEVIAQGQQPEGAQNDTENDTQTGTGTEDSTSDIGNVTDGSGSGENVTDTSGTDGTTDTQNALSNPTALAGEPTAAEP
jgi:dolichyl-diphosphooligosaccharide--protein glycosyltransferase